MIITTRDMISLISNKLRTVLVFNLEFVYKKEEI
jgi:hypothetical protein